MKIDPITGKPIPQSYDSKAARRGTRGAFGKCKNRLRTIKIKNYAFKRISYQPGYGCGAPIPTNKGRIMGLQKYVVYSDGSLRKSK